MLSQLVNDEVKKQRKGRAMEVKKKRVIAVVSIGIAACITACGSKRPSASDITVNREHKEPTFALTKDIDSDAEETGKIIEELSSFYQIDIHWDESFAQAKREKFEDKYMGN